MQAQGTKNDEHTFEIVGQVGVDGGQVAIVDPCYTAEPVENYAARGLAVVKDTEVGDGLFDVVAHRNEHGQLVALIIDFDPEPPYWARS